MEVSTIIGIGLIINGTGFVFIILILLRILATVKDPNKKKKETISEIISDIKELSMKEVVGDTIKIIAAILTILVMILNSRN
jgi:hypothetical protein